MPREDVLRWWGVHKAGVSGLVDAAILDQVDARVTQGGCAVFFGGEAVVLVLTVRDGLLWVEWLWAFERGCQVVTWREALVTIARQGGFKQVGCRALSEARARLFRRVGFVMSGEAMVLEV